MDFVKMQGLGNDFVVIEGPAEPTPAEIASWCDRRRGVGRRRARGHTARR